MANSVSTHNNSSPRSTIAGNNRNGNGGRTNAFLAQANHVVNSVSIASVFAMHFLLTVGVLLLSDTYRGSRVMPYFALYNSLFFLSLFWSVHEHLKPGPLQMATVTNLVSIVFDLIVACGVSDAALWFLVLNILFRPFTSFVLLRRAYTRKRRFALHTDENISLGAAIRNLLFNTQQSEATGGGEGPVGTKDPLGVFSTVASRDQTNAPHRQPSQHV